MKCISFFPRSLRLSGMLLALVTMMGAKGCISGSGLTVGLPPEHMIVDPSSGCSDAASVSMSDRRSTVAAKVRWCTIEAAVHSAALQPGDTIAVRAGTYTVGTPTSDPWLNYADECGMTPQVNGTKAAPITLRNYPNEKVRIDARIPITTWRRCSSNATYCTGVPSEVRGLTWEHLLAWNENTPFGINDGQLWEDDDPNLWEGVEVGQPPRLMPSLMSSLSSISSPFTDATWAKYYAINAADRYARNDPSRKRLFYRMPNAQSPVPWTPETANDPHGTRWLYFSSCTNFFTTNGVNNWDVKGIDFHSATGAALAVTRQHESPYRYSYNITFENNRVRYSGNNACSTGPYDAPIHPDFRSRDRSFGHGLLISGATAFDGQGQPARILVLKNEFTNTVAETMHVGNNCANRQCGEQVQGSYLTDAAADPGWNSECSIKFTPTTDNNPASNYFQNELANGIIVRSNGGIYSDDVFSRNDGIGFSFEAEGDTAPLKVAPESGTKCSEGPAAPSFITIERSTFEANESAGVAGTCISATESSQQNKLFNNRFIGNGQVASGNAAILLQGDCDSWSIINNSVTGTPGTWAVPAIAINDGYPPAQRGTPWCTKWVAHPTNGCMPSTPQYCVPKRTVIQNNALTTAANAAPLVFSCTDVSCYNGATFSKNLLWRTAFANPTLTPAMTLNETPITPAAAQFWIEDPAWDADQVPLSGSRLAASRADADASPLFTTDWHNGPRPATRPWSIGAYHQ